MAITPASLKKTYPANEIDTVLTTWWDSKQNSPLAPPKIQKKDGLPETIFALQPELSSQQAVVVLIKCIDILGFRPTKKTIKKGGYANKEDFIKSLGGEIEAEWNAKHGESKPANIVKEPSNYAAIGI